ncbi:ATP-binding cassette sub-family A member 3, partial [Stegodyphus mimosarum]
MLKLEGKRNELAKNLSLGMKRKLSLGIAIIGDSKVLILDEPTSGMDVEARQNVWNALLDSRPGRTVILTTHSMEEAEILGDRVAIMTEGEIQCCGSPSFLKRKFGAGYHLHITKAENLDLDTLTGLLREYASGSTMELDTGNEVIFYLPFEGGASYGDLFGKLESHKDDFGFTNCKITATTLEDVYLNIANLSDKELKIQENK